MQSSRYAFPSMPSHRNLMHYDRVLAILNSREYTAGRMEY